MSKPTLTEAGFQEAADSLGVEVAAIKAVAEIESRGSGFLPDGRPTILFERHKFHKFTKGKFDQSHPDISSSSAGGYGKGGSHQWDRYNEAHSLDPDAAKKSCSWGKFQIMGFNFAEAGFESVSDFVDSMNVSEDEQLKAFVNFVDANGLAGELKRHDWAGFAKGYNGADYKINKYDTKLASAYRKYQNAPVADEPGSPVTATVSVSPAGNVDVQTSTDSPKDVPGAQVTQENATTVTPSKPTLLEQIKDISIPAGLGTVLATIGKVFMSIPPWAWALIIVVIILSTVYLIVERRKMALAKTLKAGDIAADPAKNNIWFS